MIQVGGKSYIIFSLNLLSPMKLTRLIKICPNEIYSRVRVGEYLSDILPFKNGFKQGDALSSCLFNFALEYVIKRVKVNQGGSKLNGAL